MSKHTPGPWEAIKEGLKDQPFCVFPVPSGSRIAVVDRYCDPRTGKELSRCESDARLIAAAPELLEALYLAEAQLAEESPAHDSKWGVVRGHILRAIAKAEGRS